jgi:hypothetical protein
MIQNRGVLTLQRMDAADLGLVETWLRDPEVARWYLAASTLEEELDELRQCIGTDGDLPAAVSTGRPMS